VLVAQAGAGVIATAGLLLVPNLTHHARPWAIVENLVVDETARGQRAGRALIDEIVARAERAGCYMIQLLSLNHIGADELVVDPLGVLGAQPQRHTEAELTAVEIGPGSGSCDRAHEASLLSRS
jgi:GNAT superfamily N-acetyltransferase